MSITSPTARFPRHGGPIRFTAALAAGSCFLYATGAHAQIVSADVYERIGATVAATDDGAPPGYDSFTLPPMTTPVIGSGSGNHPFTRTATAGGSSATVTADYMQWAVSPEQITGSAEFHQSAHAGGGSAAATIDALVQIIFRVAQETPFTLTGYVQYTATQTGDSPNDNLRCSLASDGIVGGGFLRDATAGPADFQVPGYAYPQDSIFVQCGVERHTDFPPDDAALEWSFTLALGSVTTTTIGASTTTTTLPRRACRRACRRATKACRKACRDTPPPRRACKQACKQRGAACGAPTGCMLPAS